MRVDSAVKIALVKSKTVVVQLTYRSDLQLYYENGRSVKSVYRALRPIYGIHNHPTERTIRHTIGKLENNLKLLDETRTIRPRNARTVENIAAVNESFAEDPEESIRRRSQ